MTPPGATAQRIRHISSAQNSVLKRLRALLQGSDRGEREFAFEGEHLLEESLRSPVQISTLVLARGALERAGRLLDRLPAEVDVISVLDPIYAALSSTQAPQGIAAIARAPHFELSSVLQAPSPLLVIAAALQDPGNLGTLLRSAEAFHADAVLSLPGTVSPWNQKTLRASAGSAFRMPVILIEPAQLHTLRQHGVRVLATALHDATALDRCDLRQPTALLIGNEGAGLAEPLLDAADERITIPCPGPVESLNAAVAASILLYEAARQRRVGNGTVPGPSRQP